MEFLLYYKFKIIATFAGGETWFEQHLKIRAGKVAPLKMSGRARILPKRSSPRWGEQAVLREQGSAAAKLLKSE